MTFIQKARLTFLGIDDELKNDASSVYTTPINSSFFPVPVDISSNLATEYQYQRYGVRMDPSNNFVQRSNTKRMKFSLNGALNNITLSNKAKIIIESVTIPNVLSHTFKQSKCVNNIQLRLRGLSKNISWDSTSKGKSTLIFSSPVFFNTQGFSEAVTNALNPDGLTTTGRPRINADNNGRLFINTSPETLYNFNIDDSFLKNGVFEFELLYDIGNCIYNEAVSNQFTYVPQTINFNNDKDDFEAFQISLIVMDVEEDDKLYDNKEMLNKINKLLIEKYSMK
jgi:hypothetical protein